MEHVTDPPRPSPAVRPEPEEAKRHVLRVAEADAGARLDRWLANALPEMSRTRLKALIEQSLVTADGTTIADPSQRVKPGWRVCVRVPTAEPAEPSAQAMDLRIVFEDEHLIVIDKPAGLVVHPAPGNPDRTLVNALLAHCGESLSGIGGVRRPGIVHRLDKDTSGLMVVAKTDAAHAALAAQFAAHSLERAYLALVWGRPLPPEGEISGDIGRNPANRKKMAVVRHGGKPALTRYRTLKSYRGGLASLVECRLATGRTHQIRVHMTKAGHPLIGDAVYGRKRRIGASPGDTEATARLNAFPRQALHAFLIGFLHPKSGEQVRFESKISSDINELLSYLDTV